MTQSVKIWATSLPVVSPAWFDPIFYTSQAFNQWMRVKNSKGGLEQGLHGFLWVTARLTITERSWCCCQCFFSSAMEKEPHPSWRTQESLLEHMNIPAPWGPCVLRGKWYKEFIGAHICAHIHHQGKRQTEGTLRKFEKLFEHGTVSLWIELIFASRTWTVKVGFGFCCSPSPRWLQPLYLYSVMVSASRNLNAGKF